MADPKDKITTTTGDYTIEYEIKEDSVDWTICGKDNEPQITSTTDTMAEAIEETTKLTKES